MLSKRKVRIIYSVNSLCFLTRFNFCVEYYHPDQFTSRNSFSTTFSSVKQSSNLVKDIWCIVSPHSINWIREPYLGNLSFTSELVFPNSFGWFCQRIWAVSTLSILTLLRGLKSQTEYLTLASWIPHPISIFDQPRAIFILQNVLISPVFWTQHCITCDSTQAVFW